MPTLYSMPGTCALSVHIAFEWAEIPVETRILARGENHQLDYLQVNPLGSVPALQLDDGSILLEAAALLTYVDALRPEAFAAPTRGPLGRAQLASWLSYFTTELHAAFGPHFAPSRYMPDQESHDTLRAMAYERLLRLLDLTDDMLTGPYVFGDDRSVADAYLYVITRWIDATPLELTNFPLLAAFKRRMDADSVIMRVLESYGEQQLLDKSATS